MCYMYVDRCARALVHQSLLPPTTWVLQVMKAQWQEPSPTKLS